MVVDERDRLTLHRRLEEVLGRDAASTMMAYLPPLGWAEVATKRDLSELEHRLEAVEHRIVGTLRADMIGQTRTMVFALMGSVFTSVSLAFAAARLA